MDTPNQSQTKCPKCGNTYFELIEDYPTSSNYKFWYMRCSSCKTFLQAMPFLSTNSKIIKLQEDIDKIKIKLGVY